MTEENMATQEAEEVEESTPDEQPQTDTSQDEDSAQLKAQLEKERKAREESERKLEITRQKSRERWERKQEQNDGEEEADAPLTASALEAILSQREEKLRKEMQSQRISEVANKFASTPEEKDLVLETYRNRQFPEHLSLEEQLEEASLIAFKHRYKGERAELIRAAKGKVASSSSYSSTQQDSAESNAKKIGGADGAEMSRIGFTWNSANKRYEKKLGNGKVLTKYPGRPGTQVE
jgi:hypothetical protein